MKPYRFALQDLLPHAGPMILLDEVIAHDETNLTAAVTVRPGRLFFVTGRGMPSHVAIEWMAQACGACAGAAARGRGLPVRIGLLLGTRNFVAKVAWFPEAERLHVKVRQSYNDGQMGSFDCRVENSTTGAALATAQLMVYQPDDVSGLLATQPTRAA